MPFDPNAEAVDAVRAIVLAQPEGTVLHTRDWAVRKAFYNGRTCWTGIVPSATQNPVHIPQEVITRTLARFDQRAEPWSMS